MIWRVRDRGTFEALGRARARGAGPIRLRQVPVDSGPPRVAYAVGRAVGGAVVRNRVRRRLREAIRANRDHLQPATAYLVSAGPRAVEMSAQALVDAVAELLDGERRR